jgi:hypothetical protein
MENSKVTRSWGTAAAVLAAVVCIAAAALTLTTTAKAQQPAACCPAVVIQWQPQSILEAKFRARILEDNASILKGLQAIADNPNITEKEMDGYVGKTYFRVPRLLTDKGWIEGWTNVLPVLKEFIKPRSHPVITSVSVVINYQPYAGAKLPEEDIDAGAKINFTFSASPDGRTGGGELKHSRICEII